MSSVEATLPRRPSQSLYPRLRISAHERLPYLLPCKTQAVAIDLQLHHQAEPSDETARERRELMTVGTKVIIKHAPMHRKAWCSARSLIEHVFDHRNIQTGQSGRHRARAPLQLAASHYWIFRCILMHFDRLRLSGRRNHAKDECFVLK